MKICAIISEYNPLHNGHIYHINKTKELTNSDAIICIMSGNYVQRGIPAIIDKWNRTKAALKCGADLVIELPVIYSLSSAEFFAFGAVSLLNSLRVVDYLSFGSEIGNINFILDIAKVLNEEPLEFKTLLRSNLNTGSTYPSARSKALIEFLSKEKSYSNLSLSSHLNSSNNILAIEYCKSLIKLNSNIKPITIKREGGSYNSNEFNNKFSSATSIRNFLKENSNIYPLKNHLPFESFLLIDKLKNDNYEFIYEDLMFPYIKYKYFTSNEDITNLPDVSEGIHNRIYKALKKSLDYYSLIENIKSKRYTYTRISRILCQYYIGFENYNTRLLRSLPCPYARILGFNENGIKVLRKIKGNSSIPVYTKLPNNAEDTLALDIQSTKSYSILNKNISPYSDYLISPIKI